MGNIPLIIKALEFAAFKHRGQRRKNVEASPYINHPIELARVLSNEGGCTSSEVLCAALLHDTIEDTETTVEELLELFGESITQIVLEVSDDKSLPKAERKRLQIEHAAGISHHAKMIKLADKICNLRNLETSPPADWPLDRRRAYFDWAKQVVDQMRGIHAGLEALFDEAYSKRP
jgi:GTP diphosphokinase / guanosine-3',5'-bis(diphosphate) 3'-diphosphatase